MTPEQIVKRMRRDSVAIARYRDALLSAGVDPDGLTDEQVIDRTARLMVAVLEFGRQLRPFVQRIGEAITRIGVAIREAEERNPAFAAIMAAEHQRMEAENGR